MIHSGSRNIGKQVAEHYNKLAVKLNSKYSVSVNPAQQLNYLLLRHEEGQTYFNEMRYCVEFALANRKLMMKTIQNVVN